MIEETVNNIISDPGEVAFVVHSNVQGPIRDLTFLQRALLFAELSMISYNDEAEARRAAKVAGFDDVTFYDHDGSQAFRFRNEFDCVIACRGTEPNEWNDIQADANAASVVAETVGKVHRGFKREVDDLWPMIETALMSNQQPLWFCGHSLGGAMATICSGRCFLSHIPANPEQLYTYGSPRVGNNRYVNYVNLDHFRFVNNNDIVTRVPPALLGYRHCGNEVYIDRNGKLGRLGMILKRRDRWWGFIHGLRRRKIDHFSDHSIHEYIAAIHRAVEAEQQEMVGGGVAKSGSEFACDEREWTVDQAELDLPHLKRRDGGQPSPDTSSDDDTDPHKKSLQG